MANYGDAEAAVVAVLRASPLVAAHGDVGVATDLVGYRSPQRWLRVVRTGGVPTPWRHLDNPKLEIVAYAETKGAALDLAAAARMALFAARGYDGNGLHLQDVADDDAGLSWSPDEADPTVPRYRFGMSLVTTPWTEPEEVP